MRLPPLSPAAALVRQFDPDLFRTALFAPEPARERLMVLYAFDIELSKSAARAAEPMMARMRLQWWRDQLAAIAAGEAPGKHELAEPLQALLSAHALPGDDLERLIAAREIELDGPFDDARFADWLDGRFSALTRLAAHLLAGEDLAARVAAGAVGHAVGVAFVLRSAVPMAAEANQYLLPGLDPEDRSALSRGRTTEQTRVIAQDHAGQALALLATARSGLRSVPKPAVPAFLPAWRAERVLRRAQRQGLDLQRDLAGMGQGGQALALTWRALRGRW